MAFAPVPQPMQAYKTPPLMEPLQTHLGFATRQLSLGENVRQVWYVHHSRQCLEWQHRPIGVAGECAPPRAYVLEGVIGSGTTSLALHVIDVTDPRKPVEAVLRLSLADNMYMKEMELNDAISRGLLDERHCQNVPRLFDWFLCTEIPIGWLDEQSREMLQKVQRLNESGKQFDLGCSVTTLGTMGSLYHYIRHSVLNKQTIACLAFQLLFALANFKELRFLHRDIKSQNVVCTPQTGPRLVNYIQYGTGAAKSEIEYDPYAPQESVIVVNLIVIDYDHSKQLETPEKMRRGVALEGQVSSLTHRAPEFFFSGGEPLYRHESDVFSIGVIILEMVVKRLPFYGLFHAPAMFAFEYTRWMAEASPEMVANGEDNLPAHVLWNMVEALGAPPNRGMYLNHPILKLIQKYEKYIENKLGWLITDNGVVEAIGAEGRSLLLSLLEWIPDERPNASAAIYKMSTGDNALFAPLIRAATQARHTGCEVERWGFATGWFGRHVVKPRRRLRVSSDCDDDDDDQDTISGPLWSVSRDFVQMYSTCYRGD